MDLSLPSDCDLDGISKEIFGYFKSAGDEMQNGKNRLHFTRMRSLASQLGHAQVVANNALVFGSLLQTQVLNAFGQTIQSPAPSFAQMQTTEPMEVRLPNEPPPSILNQNSTTEQRPTSQKYGRYLQPGGCKFTS